MPPYAEYIANTGSELCSVGSAFAGIMNAEKTGAEPSRLNPSVSPEPPPAPAD